MLGLKPRHPISTTLDLDKVREILAFIRDDLQRVAGLEVAASALSLAVIEIERARRVGRPIASGIIRAQLLRRRPN